MDPVDLELWVDFLAWPHACLVTIDLPGGHWDLLDPGYHHWTWSWLVVCFPVLMLDLLHHHDLAQWPGPCASPAPTGLPCLPGAMGWPLPGEDPALLAVAPPWLLAQGSSWPALCPHVKSGVSNSTKTAAVKASENRKSSWVWEYPQTPCMLQLILPLLSRQKWRAEVPLKSAADGSLLQTSALSWTLQPSLQLYQLCRFKPGKRATFLVKGLGSSGLSTKLGTQLTFGCHNVATAGLGPGTCNILKEVAVKLMAVSSCFPLSFQLCWSYCLLQRQAVTSHLNSLGASQSPSGLLAACQPLIWGRKIYSGMTPSLQAVSLLNAQLMKDGRETCSVPVLAPSLLFSPPIHLSTYPAPALQL